MFRRLFAALLVVAVAAALLVGTWPQLFALERSLVVVQFVSFRGLTALIALAGLVIVLILAGLSRGFRRLGGALGVLLLVFALAGAVIVGSRGFGDTEFQQKSPTALTIVEWNTLGAAPGVGTIATLAENNAADVVVLPETDRQSANQVAALMEQAGHPMTVHTTAFNEIAKAKSTSILTSTALGGYSIDETVGNTSTVPTVILRPDDGSGPTIVGVHAVAPQPAEMDNWRSDLRFVKSTCSRPNTILVGDFNATLDHLAGLGSGARTTVGECTDAAIQSHNGAVGTWPSRLPALLGAPIDHVMATDNWTVTGMRVVTDLDGTGSDHRPLVVQLTPKG
ncbi:endonuclease/exonuclease/phosphatase family protein [Lacisediminihabitans changchengi]|uniref:Endonuclease/exonuclease/phosphatase family protein n=1 Tax=Lacisediminihabitans changchengi TaxID=2787634 RepID=A0A934SL56_9MICO|nr:endonuclease/exonuclease/phosphatase family protein [Lacisediminihabitans changchengi]MBK4347351.1 endonuclease/exonuclease/phosphatase family protein [Lacisediminihabitans changchengi]